MERAPGEWRPPSEGRRRGCLMVASSPSRPRPFAWPARRGDHRGPRRARREDRPDMRRRPRSRRRRTDRVQVGGGARAWFRSERIAPVGRRNGGRRSTHRALRDGDPVRHGRRRVEDDAVPARSPSSTSASIPLFVADPRPSASGPCRRRSRRPPSPRRRGTARSTAAMRPRRPPR